MSDPTLEGKVAVLETAIFDVAGNKGLITRQKEAEQAFNEWVGSTWGAYLSNRERSCFFLKHQQTMRDSKSLKFAKLTVWIREITLVIAAVTLLAKALGWF